MMLGRFFGIFGVVSVALVGCAAASDDGANTTQAADAAFAPREGVYEQVEVVVSEDTCGINPQLSQEFVSSSSASGYTRTLAFPQVSLTVPETFLAHTATSSTTQVLDLAESAQASVTDEDVDAWAGDASFVRTQTESWTCQGDGCTTAPASNVNGLMTGTLPCHITHVTRLSLAHCNHYPFRYVRPDATTSVWVSGSFNNWAKTPADGALIMGRGEDGVWTLDANLPPGPHQYKFITDGADVFDTDMVNPLRTDDGVGGWNSVANCQ